ncbi:MAG: autotransporter outer membrane beta-barrel domain-containing protein, partial [Candidatus Nucleicultricaceae bacterium]
YLTNFRPISRLFSGRTNRHVDRLALSPDSTHGRTKFVDMMRLADDGQLPETQFIIPATDLRFWASGLYNSFYNKLDNMDFAAYTKGVQVGIDSSQFGLPIGISVAYATTKPNLNNVETGRSKTITLGLYGGYAINDFTIFGTASYLHGDYKRDDVQQTKFSTKTASLYLQGRYAFALTNSVVLEPLVALTYARTWTPHINTFQAGALLSQTDSTQSNFFTTDAGFIISKFFYGKTKDDFTSKIYFQGSWNHNYTSNQKAGNTFLVGNPAPVQSYGQRQALNTANMGVGVVVRRENIDISLAATAGFARRVQSYGGLLGIRISL